VFSSTATDPTEPIEPEVARNANIYNIWTLNLRTGELRQYTDALGGNLSPVVLHDGEVAAHRVRQLLQGRVRAAHARAQGADPTAASADFGAPGPVIDFQAPLLHTLVADNKRKKGTFEKLFLEGRPPVNVGVTSGGDVFGGTQVTFSDVLGDKQFNLYAASISQYRTLAFSYVNLARRFQYAFQGYSQTTSSSTGSSAGSSTTRRSAASSTAISPSPRGRCAAAARSASTRSTATRFELFGGILSYDESFNDPALEEYSRDYQEQVYGSQLFRRGTSVPFGAASSRRRPSSASSVPSRAARCGWPTRWRPRSATRCRGRRWMATRATTCGSGPPASSRCARAASRAGATSQTSCSSAGTPRCAATGTSSSSATTRSSGTPSCGSR
jgi:hypothetical protein